tara:strand:+ start:464 stop:610 length:147 start_codon:yes stop_codon:yes gene_type:complete
MASPPGKMAQSKRQLRRKQSILFRIAVNQASNVRPDPGGARATRLLDP